MTDTATLFIDSKCALAEGPFWHPLRDELVWFDIHNRLMLRADGDGKIVGRHEFDRKVSAAAVIDRDRLLVAGAHALIRFDIASGESEIMARFEENLPDNRSNDSRVNPAGGFWIGTMPDNEGGPSGAVYQYREGKLGKLFGEVKVTNSICFSPDGRVAYFADTPTRKIMACEIDAETGLPAGAWTVFADVSGQRGSPDGAVVDAEGYLWSARWGGSCVVRHAPDGSVDRIVEVPTPSVTCPAFGGPDRKTLFISTARNKAAPDDGGGGIFSIALDIAGQSEPAVKL